MPYKKVRIDSKVSAQAGEPDWVLRYLSANTGSGETNELILSINWEDQNVQK